MFLLKKTSFDSMTDILSIKRNFCNMVLDAHPWSLAQFVMWLDIRVAEYKVNGYMVLDDEKTTKPRWLTDVGLTEVEVDKSTTLYPVSISTPQTHVEHVINPQKHAVIFDSPDNVIQLIPNTDLDDDIASLHRTHVLQSTETNTIEETGEGSLDTIEQTDEGGPDGVTDMPILQKEDSDEEKHSTKYELCENDSDEDNSVAEAKTDTVVDTSDLQLPILIKIEASGGNSQSTLPVSSNETPTVNTMLNKFKKLRRDEKADVARKKRSFSLHDDEKLLGYLMKPVVPLYQVKCRRYDNYTTTETKDT